MDQDRPQLTKPDYVAGESSMRLAVDSPQAISSEIPDWSREEPSQFWDPARKLLRTIRRYQSWHQRRGIISRAFCKILVMRHAFWSVVTGADIPLNCQIGGGLLIPHPKQVTIGVRDSRGFPDISGHVDIGAGAKVLGAIKVGPHARIGANAVVTRDVESGMVAAGIWPILPAGTD